jgi:hypothetical protein
MRAEGDTIRDIRDAVRRGRLNQPFRAADVNAAIDVDFVGALLRK